jgi:hypothetical protein
MKISQIFPSRWLKAAELGPDGLELTIRKVTLEEVGEEREQKPVMAFDETDKKLVLNITNSKAIAALTGLDDTDAWPGHKIKLVKVKVKVSYDEKTADAIRVEPPAPAAAKLPNKLVLRRSLGKTKSVALQQDAEDGEGENPF